MNAIYILHHFLGGQYFSKMETIAPRICLNVLLKPLSHLLKLLDIEECFQDFVASRLKSVACQRNVEYPIWFPWINCTHRNLIGENKAECF